MNPHELASVAAALLAGGFAVGGFCYVLAATLALRPSVRRHRS